MEKDISSVVESLLLIGGWISSSDYVKAFLEIKLGLHYTACSLC